MKLYIASDHAGVELKSKIQKEFSHIEWLDLGPHSNESVHYPYYANHLCETVIQNTVVSKRLQPCGVLICGSGVGMSIAANRHKGIRAVLACTEDVARLSRQHNASNVLCLGARLLDWVSINKIIATWLQTPFEGGRHQQRIDMLDA